MDKGVLFCTPSGQNYAYIKENNYIITLDNDWVADFGETAEKEQEIFAALKEMEVITESKSPRIIWPMTQTQYQNEVMNNLQSVVLEITQECTLRCEYCVYSGNYEGTRKHSGLYMSKDTVKSALDYYKAHSENQSEARITLYGGEALIRFDIVRYAVAYAKEIFSQKELNIKISTNGTTLSETILAWLLENTEVSLNVTINGNSHDKYRRFPDGTGSLDVIMCNIKKIQENYSALWNRVRFLANIVTVKELLELKEFYQNEIGKPPVLITGITAEGGNETIQQIVSADDEESAKTIAKESYIRNLDPYLKPYYHGGVTSVCVRQIGESQNPCMNSSCCMPFTDCLYITAEGKFGICEKTESMSGCGDLQSGIDFSYTKKLMDNVLAVMNTKCTDCWCQRLCDVCYKDFSIHSEGTVELFDSVCDRTREYILRSMQLFCEMAERNPEAVEILKEQWIKNLFCN